MFEKNSDIHWPDKRQTDSSLINPAKKKEMELTWTAMHCEAMTALPNKHYSGHHNTGPFTGRPKNTRDLEKKWGQ